MLKIEFTYNVSKTNSLKDAFSHDLRRTENRPIQLSVHYAAEIFQKFLINRYIGMSKTGGSAEWPDIQDETKRRKKSDLILRHTDTILRSLVVTRPKKLQFRAEIREGSHPKSKLSIKELARVHHFGLGIQQQRVIIPRNEKEVPLAIRDHMLKVIRVGYLSAVRNAK